MDGQHTSSIYPPRTLTCMNTRAVGHIDLLLGFLFCPNFVSGHLLVSYFLIFRDRVSFYRDLAGLRLTK